MILYCTKKKLMSLYILTYFSRGMGKKFCFGGSRVRHQFSSIDPNKLGLTGVKCSVVLDNLKEGGA